MSPNDADGMANSVDPDLEEQSDPGQHCLPRPICPKTLDHYSMQSKKISNDQELIQSDPTSCPQHQKRSN